MNDFVLDGLNFVDVLSFWAGSRSMKNMFRGSFVCLCLTLIIFLTLCPRVRCSFMISSRSVL
jgi:hypothetical protein